MRDHLEEKLRERYKIKLTDEIYNDFLGQIQEGKAIKIEDDPERIAKRRKKGKKHLDTKSYWLVEAYGKKVKVLYDSYFNSLITAVPRTSRTGILGKN